MRENTELVGPHTPRPPSPGEVQAEEERLAALQALRDFDEQIFEHAHAVFNDPAEFETRTWGREVLWVDPYGLGKHVAGDFSLSLRRMRVQNLHYPALGYLLTGSYRLPGKDPDSDEKYREKWAEAIDWLGVRFHEGIHAVGPALDIQAKNEIYRSGDWGHSWNEGVTDLATATFLAEFAEVSGLYKKFPELRGIEYKPHYAGQAEYVRLMLGAACDVLSTDFDAELKALVRRGGGCLALGTLLERVAEAMAPQDLDVRLRLYQRVTDDLAKIEREYLGTAPEKRSPRNFMFKWLAKLRGTTLAEMIRGERPLSDKLPLRVEVYRPGLTRATSALRTSPKEPPPATLIRRPATLS